MDSDALLSFLYRMPVALVQITPSGDISMITPGATSLLTQLSGGSCDNFFEIIEPLAPEIRRLCNESTGGDHVVCESYILPIAAGRMSRKARVLDISIHKIDSDNLMVLLTEVTDAKEVEKELSHRAAILDGLPASICVVDAHGKIVTTNRAWNEFARDNNGDAKLCCVSANYFSACQPAMGDEEQSGDAFVAGIQAVLEGSQSAFFKEYRCDSPTEERWFNITVNPFTAADKQFAVIAHENITWRKQAENNMRTLSQAIEQSPASVVVTDQNGRIEFVNQSFTRITGYSAEEAIGKTPSILKSGETRPEVYAAMWGTITSGKSWEGEFHNKCKDGSLYWEHSTISPLRDGNGTIVNFVSVKEDVTEKKILMERLINMQKAESIGQMAGGVAHELNNILCVVSGYAALLKFSDNLKTKQQQYAEDITDAVTKASGIIHDMMIYSTAHSFSLENHNISKLLRNSCAFIKQLVPENISVTLTLPDVPLLANVDPAQIKQVFINLATNARDAMPDGGRLSISAEVEHCGTDSVSGFPEGTTLAVITVQDSGSGMSEYTRNRIFEPFFTTREVGRGTGLGLSVVQGIITKHGGTIDVMSKPGEGAAFRICLPVFLSEPIEAAEQVEPPAEEGELQVEHQAATILLVDDSEKLLSVMEEYLTAVGYRVITAVDGVNALEKFIAEKDEIKLVISDIIMPNKNGRELYNEIRLLSESVHFLFMSGHTDNIIDHQNDLGNCEILMKPLNYLKLLGRMQELIGG